MKTYKLKNLDCANCAVKLEHGLSKLECVNKVTVNFATESMHINTYNLYEVKEKIKSLEPDIEIIPEGHHDDKDLNIKKELLPIIFLFLLFIPGIILEKQLHSNFNEIFEYLVFIAIFVAAGWKVLLTAFRNLFKGKIFDENFLMTIATLGAIFIHELPEAAGVMLFFRLGEFFETLSVQRSRKSIKSLLSIKPEYANLKSGSEYTSVSPDIVKINDEILVKPGERIPLDGVIITGESSVDTSALTGESKHRFYKAGDAILSGLICISGSLIIRVSKTFKESSISRILNLVQNAVQSKAPTEKFITRFAKIYTPVVVFMAVAIACIPPFLFNLGTFSEWLYRALVLLVISCPCALLISIPLGYFAGIGSASRKGILIKGANYIDEISTLNTVVFDKTGTLTKGTFKVTEIVSRNNFKEDEILKFAAYAELHSSHPIAVSIKEAYNRNINDSEITKNEEVPGYGVKASALGHSILAGNDKFLHKENIEHEDCEIVKTVVYIAIDKKYAGYIIIGDEEKPDAREAVASLKKLGIKTVSMFTGDSTNVAQYYSNKLGINSYYAELLPLEKLKKLKELKSKKNKIAFVGDGINDAPVIAEADVGFAMGKLGTDAAIETADVVLMTDAPSKVTEAIKISKRTKRIVLENILLVMIIKLLFIAFGAFGLSGMWEALFADVGVTLLAVLNTLRLL